MSHSLYLHIPFCRSKCRYCDFYSESATDELVSRYINALTGEWELRTKDNCPDLRTVFIGGGTPSLLSVEQWQRIDRQLFTHFPVTPSTEWTVECNPESFTEEKADSFARIGINRLTFGIQSLDDRVLRTLGRPHSAHSAKLALDIASCGAFQSIGVDVMYGLPGQTVRSFTDTLHSLLHRNNVKHLSAYELAIAENTPFGHHRRMLPLPDEDTVAVMTECLLSIARSYGFVQYEISNFAREGHCCRHNNVYWDHEEYIGLGASAHSFYEHRRFWNVADTKRYCDLIEAGMLPTETSELIDAEICARELLFLGFRRTSGLNEIVFHQKTGRIFCEWVDTTVLRRFIDDGYLVHDTPWWRPTEKGLLFADHIARELIS